jgi:N utilization substance protein B
VSSRRRSRQRALQILFLWDVSKRSIGEAVAAYNEIVYSEEGKLRPQRDEFLERLVSGTVERIAEVDRQISEHAEHWRIERMPAVDRNLLRVAVFEMMVFDTPPAVVIDEALELARKFSGEESVQFVNGVLDAVKRGMAARGSSGTSGT